MWSAGSKLPTPGGVASLCCKSTRCVSNTSYLQYLTSPIPHVSNTSRSASSMCPQAGLVQPFGKCPSRNENSTLFGEMKGLHFHLRAGSCVSHIYQLTPFIHELKVFIQSKECVIVKYLDWLVQMRNLNYLKEATKQNQLIVNVRKKQRIYFAH